MSHLVFPFLLLHLHHKVIPWERSGGLRDYKSRKQEDIRSQKGNFHTQWVPANRYEWSLVKFPPHLSFSMEGMRPRDYEGMRLCFCSFSIMKEPVHLSFVFLCRIANTTRHISLAKRPPSNTTRIKVYCLLVVP